MAPNKTYITTKCFNRTQNGYRLKIIEHNTLPNIIKRNKCATFMYL